MNENERTNDHNGNDSHDDRYPTVPSGSAEPQGPSTTDETREMPSDPTLTHETARGASDAPAAPRRRGVARPVLLGVAAGIALLLVGGVGLAIGMEVGDDDRDEASSSQSGGQQGFDDDRDDDVDGANRDSSSDGRTGAFAPSDSGSLRDAAKAALEATGGSGVSSIDVERGGYEVEVQLDGGIDTDVFVSAQGEVSDPYDRDEDPVTDPVLDLDRLDQIIAAASDAATTASGAGEIDSISATDDAGVAFEVTVRYDDGREFEASLAEDLSVASTEVGD